MEVREISISDLVMSDANTRKDLNAGTEHSSLHELAASIRENGLLSPITVRPIPDGRYEIVAGQRRFLACGSLGWSTIPAVVQNIGDEKARAVSLIENVHRADLHPLDKARAFHALMEYYEHDIEMVSRETGVKPVTIRKYLAIRTLPDTIQRDLSTREGPAKVDTLYHLARTFPDRSDAERVFKEIEGFKQGVQVQIIRESLGNVDRVPELKARALEGAFNTRVCRGVKGVHMCDVIPEDRAEDVLRLVAE
jgi:ParB family chromosome partitioning protein